MICIHHSWEPKVPNKALLRETNGQYSSPLIRGVALGGGTLGSHESWCPTWFFHPRNTPKLHGQPTITIGSRKTAGGP